MMVLLNTTLIGGVLGFGPIIVAATALLLVVFGVVFSPFAAWICVSIARSRSLDPRKYVMASVVYSVLFFLPWIYLVVRMHGRSVPRILVLLAYVILYGVWVYGSVLFSFMMWVILKDPVPFLDDLERNHDMLMASRYLTSLVPNISTLLLSVILMADKLPITPLYYRRKQHQLPMENLLIHPVHIMPFIGLLIWLTFTIVSPRILGG